LPQFSLRTIRYETASQQTRDPFSILYIGFATRYRFDVPRVRQDEYETRLEYVPDRFPINSGRLECDVRDAFGREPISQRQQIVGNRAKGVHRLARLAICSWHDQARNSRLLMDVDPAAACMATSRSRSSFVIGSGGGCLPLRFCPTCFPNGSDSRRCLLAFWSDFSRALGT